MDISVMQTLISTLGFPIVMCLAMCYYIKYTGDKNREEVQKITEAHKAEEETLAKALDNNTKALEQIEQILRSKGV